MKTTTSPPQFLVDFAIEHDAQIESARVEDGDGADSPAIEEHFFEVLIEGRQIRVVARIHSAGTQSWESNFLASVIREVPEATARIALDGTARPD